MPYHANKKMYQAHFCKSNFIKLMFLQNYQQAL